MWLWISIIWQSGWLLSLKRHCFGISWHFKRNHWICVQRGTCSHWTANTNHRSMQKRKCISMKTNDKSRLISLYINDRCDISRKHFTNCSFDIKQHILIPYKSGRLVAFCAIVSILFKRFNLQSTGMLLLVLIQKEKEKKRERRRKWQKCENIYAFVCSLQQLNCWKRAVKSEFYSLKHTSW